MDIHPTTGKVQLPHLQRTVSSRNLLLPPTSSLQRTDSLVSLKSASPKDKEVNFWVGDPEAISSVRRARKTPARQRVEHNWTRSQSLKERSAGVRAGSATSLVSRSNSMRESLRISPQPPGGRSPQPHEGHARAWSRSNSLKEAHAGGKHVDSGSNEECGVPIPTRSRRPRSVKARRRHGCSPQSSRNSIAELSGNADVKSAVWSYLDDDCHSPPNTASTSAASLILHNGRHRKDLDTSAPVTILLDGSPALPPIQGLGDIRPLTPTPPTGQSLQCPSCKPRRRLARSPLAQNERKSLVGDKPPSGDSKQQIDLDQKCESINCQNNNSH